MKPLLRASALLLVLLAGCSKPADAPKADAVQHKHEHHAPHGGTPVVLGEEIYHVELVLDAATGKLQAFILDGEMENFMRSAAPSFEVAATVNGAPQTLTFRAVADSATGETIGDTALFEAQADWLKATKTFDGTIKSLAIRGTTFTDVKFNFPKGNDKD